MINQHQGIGSSAAAGMEDILVSMIDKYYNGFILDDTMQIGKKQLFA